MKPIPCLIIGSGPAGYTAAIYAARANMQPVLYHGPQAGGQLTTTTDVENFPGYPDGVHGTAMMEDLEKQAKRFNTDIRTGIVTAVDFSKSIHRVQIDGSQWLEAQTVIIATGASAKYLGLPAEQRLLKNGGGVSACATCDGFFHRNKEVVIVGAGDSACEEAIYLSRICKKVTMLVRSSKMRASKVMQERALATENIEILFNASTLDLLGEDRLEAAVVQVADEKKTIPISGFFVAIGHTPNTAVFKDFLTLDEAGYIVRQGTGTHTNIPGIFAAGDCADHVYRQAITAAGSGCMAALDAERYLTSL